MGFVQYLSKFLPQLSDICEPLRKLTVKGVEWCWLEAHDEAVEKVKLVDELVQELLVVEVMIVEVVVEEVVLVVAVVLVVEEAAQLS